MNYWIIVNGLQQGPFSVDDLRGMSITPSTQVWAEGMPNWVSASTVPELASVISTQFSTTPPSYHQATQHESRFGSQPMMPKPDSYLVWAILSTLLCCLPFGIVSIVYSSKVDSRYSAGDYAGAEDASQKAKRWAIISAVSSLVFVVLYIGLIIVLAAAGIELGDELYNSGYGYDYDFSVLA